MSELPWTSTIQVNRLFDLLDEGLVVIDNTGAIVHSNQVFADFLQYSAGDLVDRRFEDLVMDEEKGALASHLSDNRGFPLSLSLVSSEGERKSLDVKVLSLVEEELPKGFCLVITESSKIDMSFKKIIDGAFLRFMTVDLKLDVSYVNRAFGKGASEIIGKSALDTVAPEFRSVLKEKLEDVLNNGNHQLLDIAESISGKPVTWHGLRIGPIREGEQIIGAVIAAYDITEKLAALQALKEGEEKFRGVFEHASDAITLADEEGRIVEINSAQENLFGIKREDVIGMPIWELQASMLSEGEKTPERQKYLESMLASFFEKGTAPWLERRTQGEFIHPLDGSQRHFEQTAFKIPTSKGFMLCSFVWDVTEKLQQEEALRRVERRHQQALEGADLGVWEWSKHPETGADIWHVNERFAEIMGYSVKELQSLFLDWSTIIHHEDYANVRSQWEKHESREIPHYSVEYRLKTKVGDWKWILDRGMIVEWDEDGSATKSSGTFLDITERREAQAALDEANERYKLALKGADLGVWDWNAEEDEMVFSHRWADILGYEVDEIEPNYSGWEKLIHPNDIESMESKWNAHVEGKTDFYSSEHRMRTKTGKWKWVLERGKVVELNEDGGTKRATGTLLDITESKLTEKALQQSEEKYRNLLENLPQRVFYKDRESIYIAANPAYAEDLGISPDDIVGKTDYDFFPKDLADTYRALDRKVLETLETVEIDEPFVQGDEIRVVHTVKTPVRDDEGNFVGILGIFWDITESTRAAEALVESETKYRGLVEQSVMGLAILPQGLDNIVFANPKIGDILGYDSEELLELNNEQINSLIHPDDVDTLVQYLNGLLQTTDTGESIQVRMNHQDGSQIWTEVSAGGIEFANIPAVQVSIIDITKRREAEMLLRRDRNVFHSIAQCAIQVKDTKDLSRELLNSIINSLDFDFGTFRIYNEKEKVLQYSALLGTDIKDTLDEIPVTQENAKEYIIVQAAQTLSPIFISNIEEEDETKSYLTRLKKLNAKSAVAIPILDDDQKLLGVLSLATRSPRSFTEGDKELFSTIANMLGSVLERKKAEEALQISERRYRELLTDISEGIGIADLDEKILFVNDSFAELLGYDAEELIGRSILDLVNPDDISKILKQTEIRREGKTSAYTHRFVRKDGEQRTVRVSGVPSRDDYGQIDGTTAIVTDITERVKAEEALKESEQKFRRVFESMPVAMYLLRLDENEEFILVDANPASDPMFNADHSKYLGKKISEIPLPHRGNEIPVRFKEVANTGVPWVFDQVIYHEEEIGLALQVQVFRTSVDTVVASFLDITERMVQDKEIKRLNETLARRIEERTAELAAANKELEAFAYSVSHDLRAPLRTVDGFSQALLEDYSDAIDDTGKDFLNRVRSAATHMGSLIEDLLTLSRVTRAEMDRNEVDLSEIVKEVVENLQEGEPERSIEINISDYIPARCDRRLMKLVMQNLVDNAWKFTSKTTDACIDVGSMEREGETLFYVKDNGAGFDMDYSDKLFAPFQRLHPSEEYEGSGIGLATVQRIISRHGGRVWAESKIDEGSTFYFTIPE